MPKAKIVRDSEGRFYGIEIACPGCRYHMTNRPIPHVLPLRELPIGEKEMSPNVSGSDRWTFNGDFDNPTFSPSLNTWWHKADGTTVRRCHSFIRDGRIQFLADSTHELAGQTVELPEVDG